MYSWLSGQLVMLDSSDGMFFAVGYVRQTEINGWLISSSNGNHVSGFEARPESGSETRLPDPGIRRS